ncbi:MAG: hypothetical protein JWQ38_1321 [Flavipsychrobacter sp.]|nr:hypothetical protein [Flavipsychrobacter sp.]
MISNISNIAAQGNIEEQLNPPSGWIVPEEAMPSLNYHSKEDTRRRSISYNLPLVALRAEQLIEALNDRFSIPVPITYLRIDEGTSFHILLLVERKDYLSPKIHAARLLAEQYMQHDDNFDIHFLFSVRTENMLVDPITAQGYTLMHIQNGQKNAA